MAFLFEGYKFVRGFLVLLDDVLLELILDWPLQVLLVPHVGVCFNFIRDFWVFLENVLKQEFFGESKALDRDNTHVDEFASHVIHHKVIANYEHLREFLDSPELVFSVDLRLKEVADGNETL